MSAKIIDQRSLGQYVDLLNTVREPSQSAGIPMPEVNAFAAGPARNRSLVAVSTGLLQRMNRNETNGVLAHEIAHIANGEMVTMTLIQGVVNAFAMFLARICSFFIGKMVDKRMETIVRLISTIVFGILFSILGSTLVAYFSRLWEFKADAGRAPI